MNTRARKPGKTIAIIAACIILAIILLIVNIFVGNPVSKAIAKNRMQDYIQQVYASDIKVNKVSYNFYNQYHYTDIIPPNSHKTNIRLYENKILDENVSNYFQELFNKDYTCAVNILNTNENLILPETTDIITYITKSNHYSADFEKLPVKQKMYLSIKNLNKTISKSESQQMAANLSKQLLDILGDLYHFTYIDVTYLDKHGMYQINIDDKPLTLEEMINSTQKISMGAEEWAFIESLHSSLSQ